VADIRYVLTATGHLAAGDVYITTGSMPIQDQGKANMVKVSIA
jgi:pyruvate kinase